MQECQGYVCYNVQYVLLAVKLTYGRAPQEEYF